MLFKINDLSNPTLVKLLEHSFSTITNPDLVTNYHPDFSDKPANIFYILEKGRFVSGSYYILTDNLTGEYQCSAGWYPYELNTDVALLLTRMYVNPKFRTKYLVGKHMLPDMLTEAKHFKHKWITCNEYNKSIFNWFDRANKGKAPALFNNWPSIYKQFKPLGKQDVYYTPQYVVEYEDQHGHN